MGAPTRFQGTQQGSSVSYGSLELSRRSCASTPCRSWHRSHLALNLTSAALSSCGFESKWAVMERQPLGQLQAADLFETEEVYKLKKMQKQNQQWAIPSLHSHSTTAPTRIRTRPAQGSRKAARYQAM